MYFQNRSQPRFLRLLVFGYILMGISACAIQPNEITSSASKQLRYLALGDSYTIGQGVPEEFSWPVQLAHRLKDRGVAVYPPKIIAKTGWTTGQLIKAIETQAIAANYDLVSLLIGVNNQFRGRDKGYTLDLFAKEFDHLVKTAIDFADGEPDRVFIVSIPDYGVTPIGQRLGRVRIEAELEQYNQIAIDIANNYGVRFCDVTLISRRAASEHDLIANDKLHPSSKMYARWVNEVILQNILQMLRVV